MGQWGWEPAGGVESGGHPGLSITLPAVRLSSTCGHYVSNAQPVHT